MRLSEKLSLVAGWLEDGENDLIVNAENNEACLAVVAAALVKAADALNEASVEVSKIDPVVSAEKLDELAAVAEAFDQSGDELLMKQASVLDELLLTIAAPTEKYINFVQREDDRIEQLKKKYKGIKEEHDKQNLVADSIKAIEKAPVYKQYRPLQAPLSSRYCPDHAGVLAVRIGEHTVQCVLDKKVYNYDNGYTLLDGTQVPGGDVSLQTKMRSDMQHSVFDSRSSRLGMGSEEK